MKQCTHVCVPATVVVAAVMTGLLSVDAGTRGGGEGGVAAVIAPCPGQPGASIGPDVIVGELPDIGKYGTVGNISAYALGTTSCNVGTQPLAWVSSTNAHPVIGQHLYRLKNGRFEMIGLSWLKHGFTALSGSVCCPCQGGGGSSLGVGCSDPYSASLNGSQSNLGPRHQVNAAIGAFTYPWSATVPGAPATIGRRLQVRVSDLDPSLNPGALYFGEGHYVTRDDALAGNAWNNASYRRVVVGAFTSGSWTLSYTGSTVRQLPAIYAWRDHGLGAGVPDPAVVITEIDIPSDGRMILAHKVTDLGGGSAHYEYALHNLNSHRSGGSFSIPVPAGVSLANVGFHDVDYHSGDGFGTSPATPVTYDGTDWPATVSGGAITWATTAFDAGQNANALRWGTTYNFWFDADRLPAPAGTTSATVGLWRSGTPAAITINAPAPDAPPTTMLADLNHDGAIDGLDLAMLLGSWGPCTLQTCPGNLNGDLVVDGLDLAILLGQWT